MENAAFPNGRPASWSPDGTQVTFAASRNDGTEASLYVVAPVAGNPHAIVGPRAIVLGAAWSPDGASIAFAAPAADAGQSAGVADNDVLLVRPDGSDERNLTASFDHSACCLSWSPDGTTLLVSASISGPLGSQLVEVPVNGDPIRQLTTRNGTYTNISWGPATR